MIYMTEPGVPPVGEPVISPIPGTDIWPRTVRARGGYLAVAPSSSPWRFAVIGATEEEAQALFQQSLAQWRELAGRPDPGRRD
jgi:hypothetical protein